jgi:hypothetical protein
MAVLAPRKEHDTLIRVYENAFPDDFCDLAIKAWETLTKTDEEKGSHDWSNVGFRRDKAVFMDEWEKDTSEKDVTIRTEIATSFFEMLQPYIDEYLKDVGVYDEVYCTPHNIKVQKYDHTKGGGYYQFHSEQNGDNATYLRRLLNYLVYLNDVPDGEGETEFLNQGLRNQPKKGNLVIFPAFFTHIHRGNPVYTTDKYIATGWMLWDQKPIEAKD